MKKLLFLPFLFFYVDLYSQTITYNDVDRSLYLENLKLELVKEWPKNRTINIVFHGHSVPSGYFKTPLVNTFSSYPYIFLRKLKAIYPIAVVNIIVTAIGGEDSERGSVRFERDVLTHNPDLLFIDYGLNDRRIGLENAYGAWNKMIKASVGRNIKVILLTPSPDQRIDYNDPSNELKKHADQISRLARENQVGLVDSYHAFDSLYHDKEKLSLYMSQVNHPNESGHELISNEIIKFFK